MNSSKSANLPSSVSIWTIALVRYSWHFSGVSHVEIADHRLIDELELRDELRLPFDPAQFLELVGQRRLHLVDLGVDQRDMIDDGDGLRGVLDLEVADHIGEHLQPGRRLGYLLLQLSRVGNLGQLRHALPLFFGGLAVRIKRFGLHQELHAQAGELLRVLGNLVLQGTDRLRVGVAEVLQRDDRAANRAELREKLDELANLVDRP
jgi:hypothetical protein